MIGAFEELGEGGTQALAARKERERQRSGGRRLLRSKVGALTAG